METIIQLPQQRLHECNKLILLYIFVISLRVGHFGNFAIPLTPLQKSAYEVRCWPFTFLAVSSMFVQVFFVGFFFFFFFLFQYY